MIIPAKKWASKLRDLQFNLWLTEQMVGLKCCLTEQHRDDQCRGGSANRTLTDIGKQRRKKVKTKVRMERRMER